MTNSTKKWSPHVDTKNRLDAKNPDREGVLTGNPYMRTMHEIRSRLRLALDEIPICPSVKSLDELFTEAEKVVHANWQKHVAEILDPHRQEWLKMTEGNEGLKELSDILRNDKVFEEKLRFFQLGPLEPLRTIAPESWYQLLLASSERQLAQITLLRRWMDQEGERLPVAMDMTPDELRLVIDMGNIGKFVNMAFLKQTELADTLGGSEPMPLAGQTGSDRVYEVYKTQQSEDYQVKTYGEMFKAEWDRIVSHLKHLSAKTASLVSGGKIPDSYKGLPEHLNRVAEVYGSSEKDLEKLDKFWQDLDKSGKELAEAGCPISVIGLACAGVAGEANKADIELRVGLRDAKAEAFEKTMGAFHQSTQSLQNQRIDALGWEPSIIPTPQVSRQLYSFGTNMVWETPADTREEATNIHYNTIIKEGMLLKPVLDKVLPENPVSEEAYKKAFVLDTALHELGHGIIPSGGPNTEERIGTTNEAGIMEELKAETLSFAILSDAVKRGEDVDMSAQAMAKLAVVMDYLLNKSGEEGSYSERYYYTGIAIVKELLDKEVLKESDGKYSISDPAHMVKVVADMGIDLLGSYYENKDFGPDGVVKWGKELRKTKSDSKVASFLEAVRKFQIA